MLNYNLKGTGLSVGGELRDYVEKRLGQVEKYVDGDPTAHVDVELGLAAESHARGKFRAEFTCSCGGSVYRAEHWGGTIHEAIDLASAEFSRELSQATKKKRQVFRRTAVKVKEYLRGWRRSV